MRKRSMLIFALAAALVLAGAAVATAKFDIFRAGNLILKADGGVSPKALPKSTLAPVAVKVKGEISTVNGANPPAFREAKIDFDKNGVIEAKGLATCTSAKLQSQDTTHAKKACPDSIVGEGQTDVVIKFPEQNPIPVHSPLTLFNGGIKGGVTTLFIHAYITVPAPAAIVTTVELKKIHAGRYGIESISKIPKIVGGSGSVTAFSLQVKRNYTYKGKKVSYVSAKCPDGHFNAKILSAIFKDEAGTGEGDTTLNGTVIRPCTSKG